MPDGITPNIFSLLSNVHMSTLGMYRRKQRRLTRLAETTLDGDMPSTIIRMISSCYGTPEMPTQCIHPNGTLLWIALQV